MTFRIAILAACASTLVLAGTTGAFAQGAALLLAAGGAVAAGEAKKGPKGAGTAKTFRTRGRYSAATVRGLRVKKPSAHSNSIFDRWGRTDGGGAARTVTTTGSFAESKGGTKRSTGEQQGMASEKGVTLIHEFGHGHGLAQKRTKSNTQRR